MAAERESYEGLMRAGAGTGLVLVRLSAVIPGLLPSLALAALIAAAVLVPLLVVGFAAVVLFAPLYGLWRLGIRKGRRSSVSQRTAASLQEGARFHDAV